MTPEETKAISNLRKAIGAAHKLGIRLAGMDGDLLYATANALAKAKPAQKIAERASGGASGCYSLVAYAVQECDDGKSAGTLDDQCYEDSGGW